MGRRRKEGPESPPRGDLSTGSREGFARGGGGSTVRGPLGGEGTGAGTKKRLAIWAVFSVLAGCLLWNGLYGSRGLVRLLEQRKALDRIERENRRLLRENEALEKEIYLLRNSRAYQEKVAREEYGYVRKGERVFTFPDKEEQPGRPGVGPGETVEEQRPGER